MPVRVRKHGLSLGVWVPRQGFGPGDAWPTEDRDEGGRFDGPGGQGEKDKPAETLSPSIHDAASLWAGNHIGTDAIQKEADQQVKDPESVPVGADGEAAAALLDGVQNGPASDQDLSRGMFFPYGHDESMPLLAVGDTTQFSLGSFSANADHAERFASGWGAGAMKDEVNQGTGLMYHIDAGDTKAVDLSPYSADAQREMEYVTGGTFQVTSVEPATFQSNNGGVASGHSIGLKQTAGPLE